MIPVPMTVSANHEGSQCWRTIKRTLGAPVIKETKTVRSERRWRKSLGIPAGIFRMLATERFLLLTEQSKDYY